MTTVLFLPTHNTGWRWLSVGDGGVLESGEGVPVTDEPVVAVAPADAVTLHWAALPDRSAAQATAAARILAAEASATPVGELHVAIGAEGDVGGGSERPIGVVGVAAMREWLRELAAAGVEASSLVPAPMLLPRPDEGYLRAEIAGQGLVRGRSSGFADEARLTELVTGGESPATLDRALLETAIAAAVARPPLDLRQGPFARRRRVTLDWRLIRRLLTLALVILAVTLAIDLVRIVRLNLAASAAEERADALARSGLPRGETVTDPDRQLVERLSRVRGPGGGFSATVAGVVAAVRSVPGTEITAMSFEPNGDLNVSLAAQREAAPTDLKRAIEANGYAVRAGVFGAAGGRVSGQFTVSAR
jgi:general secretion pathway protein L